MYLVFQDNADECEKDHLGMGSVVLYSKIIFYWIHFVNEKYIAVILLAGICVFRY